MILTQQLLNSGREARAQRVPWGVVRSAGGPQGRSADLPAAVANILLPSTTRSANGRARPLVFLAALLLFCAAARCQSVSAYVPWTGLRVNGTDTAVVLRRFIADGHARYLVVNPFTLETRTERADSVAAVKMAPGALRRLLEHTAYFKAIRDARRNRGPRQDAGIVHSLRSLKGVDLTVDLCPSKRPLDRRLFTTLVNGLSAEERPVPLAIAITGVWMNGHPRDLAWLKSLAADSQISVTWINHSYHHRVAENIPWTMNFLLQRGADIDSEVLKTERAMLDNGLMPSVFFRFPGLVSDSALVDTVCAFGLIPVGTDAWLAKDQAPSGGSIVLVHGNGNEPLGVERFCELLKKERENILSRSWLLYDLRESIAREEK